MAIFFCSAHKRFRDVRVWVCVQKHKKDKKKKDKKDKKAKKDAKDGPGEENDKGFKFSDFFNKASDSDTD